MEIVTTRTATPKYRKSRRGMVGMLGFSVVIAGLMIWGAWDTTDQYNALIQILLLAVLTGSYIWVYFWGRGRQEELIEAAIRYIKSRESSQATSERE